MIQTPEQYKRLSKLLSYDFTITYRPSSENVLADAISCISHGSLNTLQAVSTPVCNVLAALKKFLAHHTESIALIKAISDHPADYPHYQFREGLILYKNRILVLSDSTLQQLLLAEYHNSLIGGHAGMQCTLAHISSTFYWPNMKEMVHSFVSQSQVCQESLLTKLHRGYFSRFQYRERYGTASLWISSLIYQFVVAKLLSIKMTPFEAVYGRSSPSLLDYIAGTTKLSIGFPEVTTISQSSVAIRQSHKLLKRFFGPFCIIERIGPVAYPQQQPLPPQSIGSHPVLMPAEALGYRKVLDFPSFNLEDKVLFNVEGNDASQSNKEPNPNNQLKRRSTRVTRRNDEMAISRNKDVRDLKSVNKDTVRENEKEEVNNVFGSRESVLNDGVESVTDGKMMNEEVNEVTEGVNEVVNLSNSMVTKIEELSNGSPVNQRRNVRVLDNVNRIVNSTNSKYTANNDKGHDVNIVNKDENSVKEIKSSYASTLSNNLKKMTLCDFLYQLILIRKKMRLLCLKKNWLGKARSVKGISTISSTLGRPIMMDQMIVGMCKEGSGRLGYAKVLVEVEAEKIYVDTIEINYVDN
ncbi:ty3-gypsy retrotransposon protein [Tanacetum coccineum]